MESGTGSLPLPLYRGNKFPGRCCPNFDYRGTNNSMLVANTLIQQTPWYLQISMSVGNAMDCVVMFVLMRTTATNVGVPQAEL